LHGRVLTLVCAVATLLAFAAPAQAAPGDIFTFAGTGAAAFGGDGGAATAAALNQPVGVAWLGDGRVLVADYQNHRVRSISPSGVITTVAGTGTAGFSGDGGAATSARLYHPTDVDATADGGFLIADLGNRRVRKVSAGGAITTVAGTGVQGSSGDGGPATSALLDAPAGVASRPSGGFLVADAGSDRVRSVSPGGTIARVAGGGGSTDDGVPATSALIDGPVGIAVLPDGGFLVAEYVGQRVRRVSPTGVITRVAGTGSAGFSGDGGAATAAQLNYPVGVSPTSDGGFLVADSQNGRVRKVTSGGAIATVAGTGEPGYSGDGGPAALARLNSPDWAVEGPNGAILIADGANNRLRLIEGHAPSPWAPPGAGPPAVGELLPNQDGRALRVAPDGSVRIQVGCPGTATERCRGTVRLELMPAKRRLAASAARARVLARKRFSIAPGGDKRIKLRLSRTGRRLLRKRRTLTVRAVVARRGGPNIGQSSERVTLKLKRKKRRRG
jgi:glucose/arabinose dehydrogenase